MSPTLSAVRFDPGLVPEPVRRIQRVLEGHEVYVVGGIVRDSILEALVSGREVIEEAAGNDWDLATSARPAEVMERLRERGIAAIPVGLDHGTVIAVVDGENYEITTYRYDRLTDGRHAVVEFADTLREDLERRDFTVNAFALDIDSGEIVDECGGLEDLSKRLVRAIGDPVVRFREDYLRMLRAVRLAAQIEGTIEEKTWNALCELHEQVRTVSPERVREELLKLMAAPKPSVGLDLMQRSGLLRVLLPELEACVGVEQNKWHSDDVWWHTLHCIDEVDPRYPFLRFVMLLHDIGKPAKKEFKEEKGDFVFYDHQNVSVEEGREIMKRLRFPTRDIRRAEAIIGEHMFHISKEISPRAIRRFLRRLGKDNLRDFLRLRIADRRGNRLSPPGLEPNLRRFIRIVREIERKEECLEVRDLAIGGEELKAAGLQPGPVYSEILNYLLDKVLDEPSKNNRPALLLLTKAWLINHPEVMKEHGIDRLPAFLDGKEEEEGSP